MRTNSTREPAPRRRRSRLRTLVTALQAITLLVMGASVGVTLGLFVSLSGILPQIVDFEPTENIYIYSNDSPPVEIGELISKNRVNVPLRDVPPILKQATIAIEDSRFYQHSGVDMRGVLRATWENLRGRRLIQGGSTITQQLARNVYLSPERTFQRKLQEMILAVLMERHFTKDRILELYLNQIYYGSGAYGVEAASKVYFGKHVSDLSLSEAALLAGLPKAPSNYSPHTNLQLALDRRDVVLNRMAELECITPGERDAAKAQKITIISRPAGRSVNLAPHFVDYVTQQLRERYGDKVVAEGGLRVYTTLNYEMQKSAVKALREGVKKHEDRRNVSEGCLICIEPANGYIRAMVGSVDPASQFNRCTQALRQPGSAFKLFVYLTAFERGMDLSDAEIDSRPRYPDGAGGVWSPRNYNDSYTGRAMTFRKAIAQSVNTIAVKAADRVGVKNVVDTAHRLGITSELEPYLPLAIGGIGGVHPIEMASAYGTMGNNGVHVPPCAIIRVRNSRNETIGEFTPEGEEVVSERAHKLMDEALRGVVRSGTGRKAGAIKDARGKTGTTNNDRDAWWIGYVPNKLVTAVWVGNDNNAPMRGAYGSVVCVPIWIDFMRTAIPVYDRTHADPNRQASRPPTRRDRPKPPEEVHDSGTPGDTQTDVTTDENSDTVSLRVCDETDQIATDNCPSSHSQQFARGSEPTTSCTTHAGQRPTERPTTNRTTTTDATLVSVTVCPDSGLIAGSNCPHPTRKRMPIDDVPTEFCTTHSRSGGR